MSGVLWLVCSLFRDPGIVLRDEKPICLIYAGSRVASTPVRFFLRSPQRGTCISQWGLCLARTCVNPGLGLAPLQAGAERGDNSIQVLWVETNAYAKKKRNLVVFDASAVACCKNRLFTKLAPGESLLLALL